MTTTCADLRTLAGGRYRLAHDPAAEHEPGGRNDPWLIVIPCRFGHLFPWGESRIAFSTNGRGPKARELAALPFIRIEQDAADGFTLSFDVEHFEAVAAIAKPHRKRQWTDEDRQAVKERLAKYQFPPVVSGQKTALICPQTP